jgi:uncharacterized membrane protein (DUF106 family)
MMQMDDKAQASSLTYMLLFLVVMMVMVTTPIGTILGELFAIVLEPTIGFGGDYPVLTIFLAGLIVVFLSGSLTNFFTDWKKMGESQEIARVFQKELQKATREGNKNRVEKLRKMQPEIFKKQQEAQGGSMKSMMFLIIFILPIFIWLRSFLAGLDHIYFTVPWANSISFLDRIYIMQAWLWLYLIFSMVIGTVIRNGLKYISWSDWWKNFKSRIRPSTN